MTFAMKRGAKAVQFEYGDSNSRVSVTIQLPGDEDESATDDSNNSFDKIMAAPKP